MRFLLAKFQKILFLHPPLISRHLMPRRKMARDRREASLNASAKMQFMLTKQQDYDGRSQNIAQSSSNGTTTTTPNSTLEVLPALTVPNGQKQGKLTTTATSHSAVQAIPPAIITVTGDPILRTIEEVIAQSTSVLDTSSNNPTTPDTVLMLNGRRKQAIPQRRKKTPKMAPPTPNVDMPIATPSDLNVIRKSKSPNVSNGIITKNSKMDDNPAAKKDSPMDAEAPNPFSRVNGISSDLSHSGKLTRKGSRDRNESPTRYSLANPVSDNAVTSGSSQKSRSKSRSNESASDINGKRKRSESRGPSTKVVPPKDKLANLLKKRKSISLIESLPPPKRAASKEAVKSFKESVKVLKDPVKADPAKLLKDSVKPDPVKASKDSAKIDKSKKPVSAPQPVIKRKKLETIMNKKGSKPVWSWKGKPFTKTIYSEANKCNMQRSCYNAVKHFEGEVVKVGDCVLLRASKGQKPHVGKVAAFWDDENGDMMMTIFWYWRPEEVESTIRPPHGSMEVYVSNLRDENHVGCIDEKCYVLTLRQYATFIARSKENAVLYRRPKRSVVPPTKSSLFDEIPDGEDSEVVYFANRGYDGKHKRFWEYYFRGSRLRKFPVDL